jgi:hypothetical protein
MMGKCADSGNLTFNVEYDGINITAMPQANVSECYNFCKRSQGTYFKQTVSFVHIFADEKLHIFLGLYTKVLTVTPDIHRTEFKASQSAYVQQYVLGRLVLLRQ